MTATSLSDCERARNWVDTLERYRLGDAITDPTGYMAADLTVAFQAEWFRNPLHRAVFRAIKALVGRGARDLDEGLVIAELQHQGTYEQFANAASYICSITDGAVPPPSRQSRLFRLEEMRRAWRELDQAKGAANG